MLLKDSITSYKHLDIGNIKIAFTIVCKDDLFKDVYFNSSTIYLVKNGSAIISSNNDSIHLTTGEAILIKQHSKLTIEKFKDDKGKDFQSFLFQLYPDFIKEFQNKNGSTIPNKNAINSDFVTINALDVKAYPLRSRFKIKLFH